MYIAKLRFADLQDGNRIYEAGEQYPRPGLEVSQKRIAELAGSNNRMGYAVIEAVEAPSDETSTEYEEDITQKGEDAPIRPRSRKRG